MFISVLYIKCLICKLMYIDVYVEYNTIKIMNKLLLLSRWLCIYITNEAGYVY